MSLATPPIFTGRPLRKLWTGEEFDRVSRSGAFDGQRLELVNSELLEMPPMNPPHAKAIRVVTYALLRAFPPPAWTLSAQCPMCLGESRPLPDFVVLQGDAHDIDEHPTTTPLIIEVSDATLGYDRGEKATLYAASGLLDYWIVNLNDRCVEVHRKPVGQNSGDPRYGEIRVYAAAENLSPLAAPDALIRVADLLP